MADEQPGQISRGGGGSWLLRLIKGVFIGIGAIMPGLSGGVLMVIFGVYDPLIYFLSHLRDRFLKQLAYFIPIGIGGVAGIILFSKFVTEAFRSRYVAVFICLFIGFVLGTLPALWRTAGSKGRSGKGWLAFILAAIFIFALMMMGQQQFNEIQPNTLVWFICGAVVGLGFVVPGLATSNFLLYFGLYDKMTDGIQSLDFGVMIPLLLGLALCVILLAKLVDWLLQRSHELMYHLIFGLVVGSSLAMLPTLVAPAFSPSALTASGLSFGALLLWSLAALALGTVLSVLFNRLEDRRPVSSAAN